MSQKMVNIILHIAYISMAICILALTLCIRIAGYSTPGQVALAAKTGASDLLWSLTHHFSIEEEIATLPESMQECLEEGEWKVYQKDDFLTATLADLKQENLIYAVGLTVTDEKSIYLTKDDSLAHYVLPHEAGHAFDYEHNMVSQSEEFRTIYQKEASSYADTNYHQNRNYAKSSSEEFFASVLCDIVLDNKENLASVPETAAFIQKLLYPDEN